MAASVEMEGGAQFDSGNMAHIRKSFKQSNLSPRSPLSHGTPDTDSLDLAFEGAPNHDSMEQLYRNICEMEGSDYSPSICSFTTFGNESKLDFELRNLVGANFADDDHHSHTTEVLKEVVVEHKSKVGNDGKDDQGKGMVNSQKDLPAKVKKPGYKNIKSRLGITKPSPASPKLKVASTLDKKSPTAGKVNPGKERPPLAKKAAVKTTTRSNSGSSLNSLAEDALEAGTDNPDLGPYLLKKARNVMATGDKDNAKKAFELALRAKKSFETCANGKPNLDYSMCLHILASMYCSLGEYDEAIPLLGQAIENSKVEYGSSHALARFAGCMQLGDIYAMLGQIEKSILLYKEGLKTQQQVLGEKDPRVAETCRYAAEAHVQALQFDDAEKLCQLALDIHKESIEPLSIEEAADRRLMGLICDSKGNHEAALQHYIVASTAMSANGQDADLADVDCNIGDAYLALARYEEAARSFKKALVSFKSSKGANDPAVASVFVRLADLHNRVGKFRECKSYCDDALKIYSKPSPASSDEEIANGLIDLAGIYESMDELEQAIKLMQKALQIYTDGQGQQSTVAGIEAQMGVMYYMLGKYNESCRFLKSAITRLQDCGDTKSHLYGVSLNQLGLACVQLFAVAEAKELFEEARIILEKEYGQCHPDTLGVYSNLAGTYDALGRWDEAIEILENLVALREEKLGTANPIVEDEKRRLAELLKESGRARNRKSRSLEALLDKCPSLAMNRSIGTLL